VLAILGTIAGALARLEQRYFGKADLLKEYIMGFRAK